MRKENEVPHSNIFYLTTLREEISSANCFQPATPVKNRVFGTVVLNLKLVLKNSRFFLKFTMISYISFVIKHLGLVQTVIKYSTYYKIHQKFIVNRLK